MPITPSSNEFTVNATATDAGFTPSVAGQPNGEFLITWSSDGGAVDQDILGRVYNFTAPVGGDVLVNTEQHDDQLQPQAAALANGGYVVAYSSGEENNLPGTYAASQVLSASGGKVGAEVFGDYSDYHHNADVAVLGGGQYVEVASGEVDGQGQVHAATGTITSQFDFGYNGQSEPVAVTALSAASYLVLSNGYASEADAMTANASPDDPSAPVHGLYAQVRNVDGATGTPFLVAATTADNVDPSARVLANGNVVVTWSDAGNSGSDVYVSIVNPAGAVAVGPFDVHAATEGLQSLPAVAVLDDNNFVVAWQDGSGADGSGAGIEAQLFHADGTADGSAFVVDQTTTGDQTSPSVAAIGDGQFVVAWQGEGGIEARVLSDQPTSAQTLFTREGTLDGSASTNQTLTGADGPNSFYFNVAATSGADHITNFGKADVLLLTKPLFDGNGDGIITAGKNDLYHLDSPTGPSDTVKIDGPTAGLRYLGASDGLSVYADASVRPTGAIEGTVRTDALHGDAAGTKTDVFFYDTALGASLGNDTLTNFGTSDLLVTTTRIADNNNDGIIKFGANNMLNLGPDALTLSSTTGVAIEALHFDGQVAHNGVTYYVYGAIGGASGVGDVHFGA